MLENFLNRNIFSLHENSVKRKGILVKKWTRVYANNRKREAAEIDTSRKEQSETREKCREIVLNSEKQKEIERNKEMQQRNREH